MQHSALDSGEVVLCDDCATIDFNSLRYQKDSIYKRKSFSRIAHDSQHCNFCQFLYAIYSEQVSTSYKDKNDREHVQFSIRSHSSGSVPVSEGGSATTTRRNYVFITQSHENFDLCIEFCVLPVPTVHSYVISESLYLEDSRQIYSSRFIGPTIDIRLVKKWHQLCQEKHGEACEHPAWLEANEYPKSLRIVDVATMSLTSAPPRCKYIALSYVWGDPGRFRAFQTSSTTIQALSQPGSLRFENLPKTIADAVRLVQDIGERYFWVDSLCIVQDDEYDKASYISQMDLIYACSMFTIVAATGEDCQAGLPRLYGQPRTSEQPFVKVTPDLGLTIGKKSHKNESKWSGRGWTYQELQLSRRALIFYRDIVLWNCECDFWAEDKCLEPSTPESLPCFDIDSVLLGFNTPVSRFYFQALGYHIFHYNVDRIFTNEGDAFDAFRGILSRIQRVTGLEFYWGLPCKYFYQALLWRDERRVGWRDYRRRSLPCRLFDADGNSHSIRIPSWSWLGWYTGWYVFSYRYQSRDMPHVFEHRNTDWAAQWFRIDLTGNMSEITKHSDDYHPPSFSGCPDWVGAPIVGSVSPTNADSDYGRIVTRTSFNRLRMRTRRLDIESRENRQRPYDDKTFNLLDAKFNIIGRLHAIELLCTAKEWNDDDLSELKTNGSVYDFIVISRERGAIVINNHGDEEHCEYKLNLMSIQWNSEEPGVASRESLFQIDEKLWIANAPQWRQVILE